MLEFHPSLAVASRIPDALKHTYWVGTTVLLVLIACFRLCHRQDMHDIYHTSVCASSCGSLTYIYSSTNHLSLCNGLCLQPIAALASSAIAICWLSWASGQLHSHQVCLTFRLSLLLISHSLSLSLPLSPFLSVSLSLSFIIIIIHFLVYQQDVYFGTEREKKRRMVGEGESKIGPEIASIHQ